MDEFGPHTVAVREVIDFALSGRVLAGPFRKEEFRDFETRVVRSLDDVLRYRNDWVPRTEPWSTSEEWWDIRQSDAEALTGKTSGRNRKPELLTKRSSKRRT